MRFPKTGFAQNATERFFRSVDQLLLQDTPGYCPKGATGVEATLTLAAFEQRFRTWLLEDYHTRVHDETKCKPAERMEFVFKAIATSIPRWLAMSKKMS